MEMQANNVPYNLKWLRHMFCLTQEKVAAMLTIDRSTYAYYESGKTLPSIQTLAKLSKLYNVSLEYFMSSEPGVDLPTVHEIFRLSPDEKTMLHAFRLFDKAKRDSAKQFFQELLQAKDRKPENYDVNETELGDSI